MRLAPAIAFLLLACSSGKPAPPGTPTVTPTPTATETRALVERRAHVRLPPEARDRQVNYDAGGADTAIWARFILPDAARAQFLLDAG